MNICIVVSGKKKRRSLIYLLLQIVIYQRYHLSIVSCADADQKMPDSAKRGNHFQGTFFSVCDMRLKT